MTASDRLVHSMAACIDPSPLVVSRWTTLGHIPPIEHEHVHYTALAEQFQPAQRRQEGRGAST